MQTGQTSGVAEPVAVAELVLQIRLILGSNWTHNP